MAKYADEQEEQIRKEEAERKQKVDAEILRIENEQIAKAEALAAEGKTDEAEAVLDQPEPVVDTGPALEKPKAARKMKKIWKFRVVDADKIPREYMMPNEPMIGKIVRASSGAVEISGVEIYSENSVSARG